MCMKSNVCDKQYHSSVPLCVQRVFNFERATQTRISCLHKSCSGQLTISSKADTPMQGSVSRCATGCMREKQGLHVVRLAVQYKPEPIKRHAMLENLTYQSYVVQLLFAVADFLFDVRVAVLGGLAAAASNCNGQRGHKYDSCFRRQRKHPCC